MVKNNSFTTEYNLIRKEIEKLQGKHLVNDCVE